MKTPGFVRNRVVEWRAATDRIECLGPRLAQSNEKMFEWAVDGGGERGWEVATALGGMTRAERVIGLPRRAQRVVCTMQWCGACTNSTYPPAVSSRQTGQRVRGVRQCVRRKGSQYSGCVRKMLRSALAF